MSSQNKKFSVLGVHPVEADEPCWLIEIEIHGCELKIDFAEITQEDEQQPRANWQVPYDERVVEKELNRTRYAFFFHYLDLNKPLLTPYGAVRLPTPTQIPLHLKEIQYEAP